MRMVHSMIRVTDLSRSLDFYTKSFGLTVAERVSFPTFDLIYLSDGEGFELELTWNKGNSQSYDLGNGYGHLAFVTDDLEASRARMEQSGLNPQPIKALTIADIPFAKFFFVTDPDGYKIEVLENSGRFS